MPACVVLLDIDNTLGGNQGGIYMATLFDVICEQHEKKEAFKNKIVEKRLQKKNLKRWLLEKLPCHPVAPKF